MQLNNQTAIAFLVLVEMSVEFIADTVESALARLPWPSWWLTAQNYHVPDIAICFTMMGMIIAAIGLLEPKIFEDFAKSLWRKSLALIAVVRHKRLKQKSAVHSDKS